MLDDRLLRSPVSGTALAARAEVNVRLQRRLLGGRGVKRAEIDVMDVARAGLCG